MIRVATSQSGYAWRYDEPEAPDFTAMVYDHCQKEIDNVEVDAICIDIFFKGSTEPELEIVVTGRDGLCAWYVEHVGYDPSFDDSNLSTMNLLELVACMALLHQQEKYNKEKS